MPGLPLHPRHQLTAFAVLDCADRNHAQFLPDLEKPSKMNPYAADSAHTNNPPSPRVSHAETSYSLFPTIELSPMPSASIPSTTTNSPSKQSQQPLRTTMAEVSENLADSRTRAMRFARRNLAYIILGVFIVACIPAVVALFVFGRNYFNSNPSTD
ncbi:hypothetical protein BU16DRAFT_545390 [Lophium mytilinum]|uniref:Uncharacterized protein n=1 Tax=Lophium mytilinum TaxID=390894 RepID=A0A6A6Q7U7_9PEZI|nr:hypothetical protein BU16DRAFT_545390 [Lophium mytilinum]